MLRVVMLAVLWLATQDTPPHLSRPCCDLFQRVVAMLEIVLRPLAAVRLSKELCI